MSFINNISSEKSHVKVAVRIRPMNKREINTDKITNIRDKSIIISNPEDNTRKNFTYDYIYGSNSEQHDIYNDIGRRIINNAYKGYNSCVFAYGQTGTGKSFTMMGGDKEELEGLIPRICKGLFVSQTTHNNTDIGDCKISYRFEVSYLEIYSEKVRDLIAKPNNELPLVNLKIRQHPDLGPYVEGLNQIAVEDYASIKKIIDRGNKERMVASTIMNDRSSRSHAILTLHFTQVINDYNLNKTREVVGKINLVDLAGSERVEVSGVTGINFKEAIMINKSLSTLGLVISKLATRTRDKKNKHIIKGTQKKSRYTNKKGTLKKKKTGPRQDNLYSTPKTTPRKQSTPRKQTTPRKQITNKKRNVSMLKNHIPFRDSALTWILSESLGGNSKTYMIATISPSDLNYNESLSTLRYAYNAKHIVNTVKVNEDPSDKIIRILNDEITKLKQQVRKGSGKGADALSKIEIDRLNDEILLRKNIVIEKEKEWGQKLKESAEYNKYMEAQLGNLKNQINKMKNEKEKVLKEKVLKEKELKEKENALKNKEDALEEKISNKEKEYKRQQDIFEKKKMVETAASTAIKLQEYYEKKMLDIKNIYEARIQDQITKSNKNTICQINKFKNMNIKLNEKLKKQTRKFTSDRAVFSRQIQQLQSKIHIMTQEINKLKKSNYTIPL